MRLILAPLPFILLTVICWGMYGPVLHRGQEAMGRSQMRAMLCVGLAYFVIGVIVPAVVLATTGEGGHWSFRGVLWSSAAGTAGAIGAFGIILAFKNGGNPAYVMPMVFGLAPVVNAFSAMYFSGMLKEMKDKPIFLAGLVIVAVGAFMVLFFAPRPAHAVQESSTPDHEQSAAEKPGEA